MNRDVAEKIQQLLLQIGAQLDDSVAYVRDHASQEDLVTYRRYVGGVLAEQMDAVLNPLWAKHPELKPVELGGSYVVDEAIYQPRFYPIRTER